MRFFVVASLLLLAALVAAGPHRVQSEDCGESGGPVPTPTGDSGDSGYTPSPSPSLESYAARGLPTSNDSPNPTHHHRRTNKHRQILPVATPKKRAVPIYHREHSHKVSPKRGGVK
ncbi:hypothetical protein V8E54_006634 [Elaphomyces granulatus]